MLPLGHVTFTWAVLNLAQRKVISWRDVDYRLAALVALAPDLVDKPLALTFYRNTDAALFWGHNLWFHAAVWVGVLALEQCFSNRLQGPSRAAWTRPGTGARALFERYWALARVRSANSPGDREPARSVPYLLAFSGHLIADRMWGFQETLLYPFGAGFWHPWVHVGEPAAMLQAYLDIVRSTPILIVFEAVGLALLGWLIWDRSLWQWPRLRQFLRTGHVAPSQPGKSSSAARIQRRLGSFVSVVTRWLVGL